MTTALPTCLAAATATRPGGRRRVVIDGHHVGSVGCEHLGALAAWPQWLHIGPEAVELTVDAAGRDAALAEMHHVLHAEGRLRGWRNETFAIVAPGDHRVLALIERAAARFWGTLTFGAHATGHVVDAQGRPTHLWIAQRAFDKPTDPGLYDNLVGGGVPHGEPPELALVREAREEAGLDEADLRGARPAGQLTLCRDVAEGLQHECLHSYDLVLPAGRVPCNQDGEVAGFHLMSVAEARALAWGTAMTVDAALVTVDFLHRHGLADAPGLAAALAERRAPGAGAGAATITRSGPPPAR